MSIGFPSYSPPFGPLCHVTTDLVKEPVIKELRSFGGSITCVSYRREETDEVIVPYLTLVWARLVSIPHTHPTPSLPVLFVCSFVRSFVGSTGKVNLEKGEKREKKSKPGVKEGGGELSSWFFNQLHTFSPPFCCLPLVFLGTIWTRLTTRRPGPSPDGSSLTRLLLTFRHSCACSLTFYVTF